MLQFTTTTQSRPRPALEFELDGRPVTAVAPKAAHWARMWSAGATGDMRMVCYHWLNFLDITLGEDTAKWLKSREDDPDDAYDIPDLVKLVKFLNEQFEPLLKADFEAAGMAWQDAEVAAAPEPTNRAGRRSAVAGSKKKALPRAKA